MDDIDVGEDIMLDFCGKSLKQLTLNCEYFRVICTHLFLFILCFFLLRRLGEIYLIKTMGHS